MARGVTFDFERLLTPQFALVEGAISANVLALCPFLPGLSADGLAIEVN